jgi:hypothetical protein
MLYGYYMKLSEIEVNVLQVINLCFLVGVNFSLLFYGKKLILLSFIYNHALLCAIDRHVFR